MPSNEGVISGSIKNPYRVLILGASYGGLAAALNLLDLCSGRPQRFNPHLGSAGPKIPVRICLVDERDGYYHLIGSPLALASENFQKKAWRTFNAIPAIRDIEVIRGRVERIDTTERRATIVNIHTKERAEKTYDFLVAATGLKRSWPVVPQSLQKEQYLEETRCHIDQVKNANEGVVVIGGGAVGIEMAAEIKLFMPHQKVTLIHSRTALLSNEPLPVEFKEQSAIELASMGVTIILGRRVVELEVLQSDSQKGVSQLKLDNGDTLCAGKVIYATSNSVPSTEYMPSSTKDLHGYVKVTPTLNLLSETPNSRYHFAVGDIAKWSGIKRCGTAMHMGHYAARNIYATMRQETSAIRPDFLQLDEIPPMMGIAIGKTAVSYHPPTGVKHGQDELTSLFGDDLGDTICWNYLQLGDVVPTNTTKHEV